MSDYNPVADGDITYTASATITGGQVVEITGDGTVGPAGAGSLKVVGVAAFDAANGDSVTVLELDDLHEVTVAGGGAVTAGQLVSAGASGTIDYAGATPAVGTVIGVCTVGATAGNLARFKGIG